MNIKTWTTSWGENTLKCATALLLLFPALLLSCGTSVEPGNPYDPSIPSSQQAKATVSGTLILEASADSSAAVVSVPELGLQRKPATDGSFRLEDIPPGLYEIIFDAEGYEQERRVVQLSPGATRNLGDIYLAVTRATIRGIVSLLPVVDGAEPPAPGGTVVQLVPSAGGEGGLAAVGSSFAGMVAPDGTFSISDVPVGEYDVSAERDGYSKRSLCGIRVEEGGTDLPQPLELPPVTGLIQIQGGADYVNTRTVDLTVLAFNSAQMMLSTSPDFTGADYEQYTPTKRFRIAEDGDEDGEKTVYAKFRVAEIGCGRTSYRESDVVKASVVLDTKGPEVAEVRLGNGEKYTNEPSVGVYSTVYDKLSGVESMQIAVDQELDSQPWQDFALQQTLTFSGDGLHAVSVRFRDRAGNVSDAVTREIVLDTHEPVPGPHPIVIGDGAETINTNTVVVRLDAADPSPVEFKLCETMGCPDEEWVPMVPAVRWIFASDGEHTLYVRFRDAAGNETPEYSAIVLVDTEPPELGLVTVEQGEFVNKRLIRLNIEAEGAAGMRIAESPDLRDVPWEAFKSNTAFMLSDQDGPHRIFVQVADQAGNKSKISVASVILDRQPPSGVQVHIAADEYTNSESVTVHLDVDEPDQTTIIVSNDDEFNEPAQAFSPNVVHLLASTDDPQQVFVRFIDKAGNTTDAVSDNSVVLDTEPPTPPVLSVPAEVVNADEIEVNLVAPCTDNSGEELVYQLRTQGTDWIELSEADFPFTVHLEQDETNVVRVRALDPAGNAGSEESVVIVEDSTPPTDPQLLVHRLVVNADSVDLILASPSLDENFDTYEVSVNSGPWQDTGVGAGSLKIPIQLAPDTEHSVMVRGKDLAGNLSGTAAMTVIEDSTPPTAPVISPPQATVNAFKVFLTITTPSSDANDIHYELALGKEGQYREIEVGQDNSFEVKLDQDQENTFLLRAVDEAGNVSSNAVSVVQEVSTEVFAERNDNIDDYFDLDGDLLAYTEHYNTGPPTDEWYSRLFVKNLVNDEVVEIAPATLKYIFGLRIAGNSVLAHMREGMIGGGSWLYTYDLGGISGFSVLPASPSGGEIKAFGWDGEYAGFCEESDKARVYLWHKGDSNLSLVYESASDDWEKCNGLDLWNSTLVYAVDNSVHVYDISSAQDAVLADPAAVIEEDLDVSTDGRYVVWSGGDAVFTEIRAYDLDTDTDLGPVNASSGVAMGQGKPRIRDGKLVYEDEALGVPSVVLYDFRSGEERKIAWDSDIEEDPVVSGRFVVFRRTRGKEITLEVNEVAQRPWLVASQGAQGYAAAHGDEVAFGESRPGYLGISVYDHTTRTYTTSMDMSSNMRLCGVTDRYLAYLGISGNLVDLYLVDRQSSAKTRLNAEGLIVPICTLEDDMICWTQYDMHDGSGSMPGWSLLCRDTSLAQPPVVLADNQDGTLSFEGAGIDLDQDRLLFEIQNHGMPESKRVYLKDLNASDPPIQLNSDYTLFWDERSGPDTRTVALSGDYAAWVEQRVEDEGTPDQRNVFVLVLYDLKNGTGLDVYGSESFLGNLDMNLPYLAFESDLEGNTEVMLIKDIGQGMPKLERITRNDFYQGMPVLGRDVLYWVDGRLGGWQIFYVEPK